MKKAFFILLLPLFVMCTGKTKQTGTAETVPADTVEVVKKLTEL